MWLIYPQQVQTLVIRSLSNALVLPWPNKADNEQVRIEVNVRFHMNITRSMALWNCSVLRSLYWQGEGPKDKELLSF